MKKTNLMIALMAVLLCFSANTMAQKKKSKKPAKTEVKKDTLTVLKEQAAAGNANSLNTLGTWYYSGKNVKQDYETALKYWALAAKKDHVEAIGNMGMCYQYGRGAKKDSVLAVKLYEKAIAKGNKAVLQQHIDLAEKKGDLFSCTLLHEMYNGGKGVAIDQKKAQHYLMKAAQGGDTESQKTYAMLLLNQKNTKESAKWFKKLADKGHVTGIYYFGYQLFKGMGIKQDKVLGAEYLQRAADRGIIAAYRQLGAAYFDGEGVNQDYQKAVAYLQKAVTGRFADSQMLLARCYIEGKGVKRSYDQAMQWLAEAACQNNKQADAVKQMINDNADATFRSYVDGLKQYYVDKDYKTAASTFKKVAKEDIADAITMQALILADEENPKANLKKAFKMMSEAAEGSAAATYYLSQMYQEGKGVEKDNQKAGDLLLKAAENGNGYALCKAGDMYFEGNGVTQDYVKAVDYYLQAESQSKLTTSSARHLIRCYEMGISNLPDANKKNERIEALGKIRDTNKLLDMLKKL